MTGYDNTNSGALFKNNKRKTEKHPDYTGSINVLGIEFWISAWLKASKKTGEKYMSLSVQRKEPRVEEERRPIPQSIDEDFNDEIPGFGAESTKAPF